MRLMFEQAVRSVLEGGREMSARTLRAQEVHVLRVFRVASPEFYARMSRLEGREPGLTITREVIQYE